MDSDSDAIEPPDVTRFRTHHDEESSSSSRRKQLRYPSRIESDDASVVLRSVEHKLPFGADEDSARRLIEGLLSKGVYSELIEAFTTDDWADRLKRFEAAQKRKQEARFLLDPPSTPSPKSVLTPQNAARFDALCDVVVGLSVLPATKERGWEKALYTAPFYANSLEFPEDSEMHRLFESMPEGSTRALMKESWESLVALTAARRRFTSTFPDAHSIPKTDVNKWANEAVVTYALFDQLRFTFMNDEKARLSYLTRNFKGRHEFDLTDPVDRVLKLIFNPLAHSLFVKAMFSTKQRLFNDHERQVEDKMDMKEATDTTGTTTSKDRIPSVVVTTSPAYTEECDRVRRMFQDRQLSHPGHPSRHLFSVAVIVGPRIPIETDQDRISVGGLLKQIDRIPPNQRLCFVLGSSFDVIASQLRSQLGEYLTLDGTLPQGEFVRARPIIQEEDFETNMNRYADARDAMFVRVETSLEGWGL